MVQIVVCIQVKGMGDIHMSSETAEEQFERVDPDAPVEHFTCSSSGEQLTTDVWPIYT